MHAHFARLRIVGRLKQSTDTVWRQLMAEAKKKWSEVDLVVDVEDPKVIDTLRAFYVDLLGFELESLYDYPASPDRVLRVSPPGDRHFNMVFSYAKSNKGRRSPPVSVAFRTPNVGMICREFTKLGIRHQLIDAPVGDVLEFQDPIGNSVSLEERLDR